MSNMQGLSATSTQPVDSGDAFSFSDPSREYFSGGQSVPFGDYVSSKVQNFFADNFMAKPLLWFSNALSQPTPQGLTESDVGVGMSADLNFSDVYDVSPGTTYENPDAYYRSAKEYEQSPHYIPGSKFDPSRSKLSYQTSYELHRMKGDSQAIVDAYKSKAPLYADYVLGNAIGMVAGLDPTMFIPFSAPLQVTRAGTAFIKGAPRLASMVAEAVNFGASAAVTAPWLAEERRNQGEDFGWAESLQHIGMAAVTAAPFGFFHAPGMLKGAEARTSAFALGDMVNEILAGRGPVLSDALKTGVEGLRTLGVEGMQRFMPVDLIEAMAELQAVGNRTGGDVSAALRRPELIGLRGADAFDLLTSQIREQAAAMSREYGYEAARTARLASDGSAGFDFTLRAPEWSPADSVSMEGMFLGSQQRGIERDMARIGGAIENRDSILRSFASGDIAALRGGRSPLAQALSERLSTIGEREQAILAGETVPAGMPAEQEAAYIRRELGKLADEKVAVIKQARREFNPDGSAKTAGHVNVESWYEKSFNELIDGVRVGMDIPALAPVKAPDLPTARGKTILEMNQADIAGMSPAEARDFFKAHGGRSTPVADRWYMGEDFSHPRYPDFVGGTAHDAVSELAARIGEEHGQALALGQDAQRVYDALVGIVQGERAQFEGRMGKALDELMRLDVGTSADEVVTPLQRTVRDFVIEARAQRESIQMGDMLVGYENEIRAKQIIDAQMLDQRAREITWLRNMLDSFNPDGSVRTALQADLERITEAYAGRMAELEALAREGKLVDRELFEARTTLQGAYEGEYDRAIQQHLENGDVRPVPEAQAAGPSPLAVEGEQALKEITAAGPRPVDEFEKMVEDGTKTFQEQIDQRLGNKLATEPSPLAEEVASRLADADAAIGVADKQAEVAESAVQDIVACLEAGMV